jgi:FAD dependent oxidoreductase TIGR03364
MVPLHHAEVAVVGAGIVGLAHALDASRKGFKVVLFERNARAVGASIRNFGMIWAIGKPPGLIRDRVMRSREVWIELAEQDGLWLSQNGSLHVAHHADEMAVLEEFYETAGRHLGSCRLLSPRETLDRSPAVKPEGLQGGLWSNTEMLVNPMEAIRRIPHWLQERYGVTLRFEQTVRQIKLPTLETTRETWHVERVIVCSGVDFETLYPEVYRDTGITRVKLQMLRTVPQPGGFRVGPSLAGGQLLPGYASFAHCTTLDRLRTRLHDEQAEYIASGITVYFSQLPSGEVTIGDTHAYDNTVDPFDNEYLNQLMLAEVRRFAVLPTLEIAERWHGIYAKTPGGTELIVHPEPGVTVVNALAGGGMSRSFGLAEHVIAQILP